MAQGASIYSQNHLRYIEETTAGTYNAAGTPVIVTDLETDFENTEDFTSHRPKGYNVDLWHAMIRRTVGFSGPIKPDYAQMDKWLRALFGASAATSTEQGGVVGVREYRLANTGRRDIKTLTLEYGTEDSAKRATYGLVTDLSIDSSRAGDTEGDISIVARVADEGVAMTGGAPQNEIKTVTLTAATGNGIIAIPATSLGSGGNLTITPGQTAATVRTNLAAIASVASTANVLVSGSTTAVSAGGSVNSGGTPVSSRDLDPSLNAAKAFDANTATEWIPSNPFDPAANDWVGLDWGATSKTVNSVTLSTSGSGFSGMPGSFRVDYWNGISWVNGQTFNAANWGVNLSQTFVLTTPFTATRARITPLTIGASSSLGIEEIVFNGPATTGSGTYTITFQGALAGINIADFTTASTGYSTATTQTGSDGEATFLDPKPILPSHWRVYTATTLEGLDDTPTALDVTEEHHFGVSGMAVPRWAEDGEGSFTTHADQIPNVECSLVVPVGGSEEALLLSGSRAWPSSARWIGFHATSPDGLYALHIDIYGSVRASPGFDDNNNVWRRSFDIGHIINASEGYSLRITVKTPV